MDTLVTREQSSMLLWKKNTEGWARNHAARATLISLSDEERQELWECFQALLDIKSHKEQLDWASFKKAADAVLGSDKYNVQSLKSAVKQMDLSHEGQVSWFEFRAYMATNWSASKDAGSILNTSSKHAEDMITIDGNMRLPDLLKHYRRRVVLEKFLRGEPATFGKPRPGQGYDDVASTSTNAPLSPPLSSVARAPGAPRKQVTLGDMTTGSTAGHGGGGNGAASRVRAPQASQRHSGSGSDVMDAPLPPVDGARIARASTRGTSNFVSAASLSDTGSPGPSPGAGQVQQRGGGDDGSVCDEAEESYAPLVHDEELDNLESIMESMEEALKASGTHSTVLLEAAQPQVPISGSTAGAERVVMRRSGTLSPGPNASSFKNGRDSEGRSVHRRRSVTELPCASYSSAGGLDHALLKPAPPAVRRASNLPLASNFGSAAPVRRRSTMGPGPALSATQAELEQMHSAAMSSRRWEGSDEEPKIEDRTMVGTSVHRPTHDGDQKPNGNRAAALPLGQARGPPDGGLPRIQVPGLARVLQASESQSPGTLRRQDRGDGTQLPPLSGAPSQHHTRSITQQVEAISSGIGRTVGSLLAKLFQGSKAPKAGGATSNTLPTVPGAQGGSRTGGMRVGAGINNVAASKGVKSEVGVERSGRSLTQGPGVQRSQKSMTGVVLQHGVLSGNGGISGAMFGQAGRGMR